jgi:ribosomal protein S6--L-glutamate ligase
MLCAGRDPGKEELAAIRDARAVILPQGCRESLYRMARSNCAHVFPNYDSRFEFPGKLGQTHLFNNMHVAHPATETYPSVAAFWESTQQGADLASREYPLVFKFDWGGEGETVTLIESPDALASMLETAVRYEKTGQFGFVLQEFIASMGMSLRVVVIHRRYISYWRIQENRQAFYTNLKRGAEIDVESHPELQNAAVNAATAFCKKTGIDLAGFDFLFSEKTLEKNLIIPLFLEINYFFGRRGLGGSEAYYTILKEEIDNWLNLK